MHRWSVTWLVVVLYCHGAEYKVRVERNVAAAMRDGVVLKADIYRPEAEGTFPVLLARTPYGKQHAESSGTARRGYIVVVQDTRGRGASAGAFDPFFQEEADGYDAVEWAARLPQSSGKVGMFGGSYGGATQVMAAVARPPHLVTIVPVFPAIGFGPHQILHEGGAFRQLLAESWSAAQTPEVYSRTIGGLAASGDALTGLMRKLPVGDFMENVFRESLARGGGGYFRQWVRHAPGSPYWSRTDMAGRVTNIQVPGLYIGGWYDIFGPATAELAAAVRRAGGSEAARASRLVQGPWTHGGSKMPPGEGELVKEAQISFSALQNQWLDHWLKGEAAPEGGGIRVFLMGSNRWIDAPAWPLSEAKTARRYLAAGRALAESQPKGDGTDELAADPHDPVPTRGGKLCCHAAFMGGAYDQAAIGTRKDVLTYDTEALAADLTVAGPVVLTATIRSDAPDADLVAKLVDVFPDGKALPVADGVLRLRYREGLEREKLMEPGRAYAVTVRLGSTANTFRSGHRMRLLLAASDFPNYSVNLQSGEPLETGTRARPARIAVLRGGLEFGAVENSR